MDETKVMWEGGLSKEKKFPEGKPKRSDTVRIPAEMLRAIEEFLKTDMAKSRGFRYKSDVVTAAVRDLLDKYGVKPKLVTHEK